MISLFFFQVCLNQLLHKVWHDSLYCQYNCFGGCSSPQITPLSSSLALWLQRSLLLRKETQSGVMASRSRIHCTYIHEVTYRVFSTTTIYNKTLWIVPHWLGCRVQIYLLFVLQNLFLLICASPVLDALPFTRFIAPPSLVLVFGRDLSCCTLVRVAFRVCIIYIPSFLTRTQLSNPK